MKQSQPTQTFFSRFKPGVNKNILLFLAGFLWIVVGTMLLLFAFAWLRPVPQQSRMLMAALGVILGLFVHHFGF